MFSSRRRAALVTNSMFLADLSFCPRSRQDTFLEHLYQELDKTGLSDNTYVIVVGDHGEVC